MISRIIGINVIINITELTIEKVHTFLYTLYSLQKHQIVYNWIYYGCDSLRTDTADLEQEH